MGAIDNFFGTSTRDTGGPLSTGSSAGTGAPPANLTPWDGSGGSTDSGGPLNTSSATTGAAPTNLTPWDGSTPDSPTAALGGPKAPPNRGGFSGAAGTPGSTLTDPTMRSPVTPPPRTTGRAGTPGSTTGTPPTPSDPIYGAALPGSGGPNGPGNLTYSGDANSGWSGNAPLLNTVKGSPYYQPTLADSPFGGNPWMPNPTGTSNYDGTKTGYNSMYYPTKSTADKFAQMYGGTVVPASNDNPVFGRDQNTNFVQMPDGRIINPGQYADLWNHGYSQSYIDDQIKNFMGGPGTDTVVPNGGNFSQPAGTILNFGNTGNPSGTLSNSPRITDPAIQQALSNQPAQTAPPSGGGSYFANPGTPSTGGAPQQQNTGGQQNQNNYNNSLLNFLGLVSALYGNGSAGWGSGLGSFLGSGFGNSQSQSDYANSPYANILALASLMGMQGGDPQEQALYNRHNPYTRNSVYPNSVTDDSNGHY